MPIQRSSRPWARRSLAMMLALAATAVAGCGSNGGATGSPAGDSAPTARSASDAEVPKVTWSMPYPVSSLDPAKAFNTSSQIGTSIGLETLVEYDRDGALKPLLAESWETKDATRFVYRLRSGVTFWDGSEMTADDVVYSLERHRDRRVASQMAGFFDHVKSIRATGPLEVTVTLDAPDAAWQFVPAITSQVVSKAYAEKVGNRALGGAKAMTMGTGPYRFAAFKPDEELVAERYDGYWGDKPAVKQVTIRTIEDDSTRLLAMRSGEIDGSFYIPPGSFRQWQRLSNATTTEVPGADSYMFVFNTTKAPFSDVHVRRAFAYALDNEGLANSLLKGQAQPADLFIPRRVWSGLMTPDEIDAFYAGLPSYDFDMDKAKAELAKSAHPNGFEVEVRVPSATDQLAKAALALGQNLAQLGIRLKITEIPAAQWTTRLYGHQDLSFETLGEASMFADPSYFASFLDRGEAKPNGRNYASFDDPEATAAFRAQHDAADPEARLEPLKRIATIAAEQVPYLGVYWQKTNVTVSNDLVYDDLGPWFYATNWAARIKAAG